MRRCPFDDFGENPGLPANQEYDRLANEDRSEKISLHLVNSCASAAPPLLLPCQLETLHIEGGSNIGHAKAEIDVRKVSDANRRVSPRCQACRS